MRKFLTSFLLFFLITLGLYLSQKDNLATGVTPPSPNFQNKLNQDLPEKVERESSTHTQVSQAESINKSNVESSFQLAKQMRYCRNVVRTEQELNEWLDQAQLNQEPQAYIDDMLTRYEQCSATFLPNTNYVKLLLNAAESGHTAAINMLWSVTEKEYFTLLELQNLSTDETITHRKNWLATKYEFAKHAALSGDETSLSNLVEGFQHYDPTTNSPNLIQALAYAYYGLDVVDNNDVHRRLDWFRNNLEKKLTDEQISDARELLFKLQQNSTN